MLIFFGRRGSGISLANLHHHKGLVTCRTPTAVDLQNPGFSAMQTLLLPASRSGSAPPSPSPSLAAKPLSSLHRPSLSSFIQSPNLPYSLSSLHLISPLKIHHSLPFSPLYTQKQRTTPLASSPPISAAYASPNGDSEKAKLAQVIFCSWQKRCLRIHLWIELNGLTNRCAL